MKYVLMLLVVLAVLAGAGWYVHSTEGLPFLAKPVDVTVHLPDSHDLEEGAAVTWNGIEVARVVHDGYFDRAATIGATDGEFVDDPNEIRPALERARESGLPSLINVHIAETMRMSSNYSQ